MQFSLQIRQAIQEILLLSTWLTNNQTKNMHFIFTHTLEITIYINAHFKWLEPWTKDCGKSSSPSWIFRDVKNKTTD